MSDVGGSQIGDKNSIHRRNTSGLWISRKQTVVDKVRDRDMNCRLTGVARVKKSYNEEEIVDDQVRAFLVVAHGLPFGIGAGLRHPYFVFVCSDCPPGNCTCDGTHRLDILAACLEHNSAIFSRSSAKPRAPDGARLFLCLTRVSMTASAASPALNHWAKILT
ncbi:hypothetical protein DFH09DRAFT_1155813 [Mycena vulgaris]|nr:hypothetical protein DFH09DRAFT_1155813 [Mycena vulgaris]